MISQLHHLRLYIFQGNYLQVAPDGYYCKKKGTQQAVLRSCYKNLGEYKDIHILRADCEDLCDNFTWCIGYSHSFAVGHCHMFTRQENICPSGFIYMDGAAIMSVDEFEGRRSFVWNGCYVKGRPEVGRVIYLVQYIFILTLYHLKY